MAWQISQLLSAVMTRAAAFHAVKNRVHTNLRYNGYQSYFMQKKTFSKERFEIDITLEGKKPH